MNKLTLIRLSALVAALMLGACASKPEVTSTSVTRQTTTTEAPAPTSSSTTTTTTATH